jgi:aryl-alcohol dehydrogenase-like predicted oxidoreductase
VKRPDVVVATKAMGTMGPGANEAGASRFHLLHEIDASLARLGMDHVDLYQIHGWDALTPIEETLRALEDIVRSGRARYIGVSNWAAWQIMKALGISERLGIASFASLQAYYTVAGRDLEREIVPLLQSEGLGLMVWSPLAGGCFRANTPAPPTAATAAPTRAKAAARCSISRRWNSIAPMT